MFYVVRMSGVHGRYSARCGRVMMSVLLSDWTLAKAGRSILLARSMKVSSEMIGNAMDAGDSTDKVRHMNGHDGVFAAALLSQWLDCMHILYECRLHFTVYHAYNVCILVPRFSWLLCNVYVCCGCERHPTFESSVHYACRIYASVN